MWRRRLDWRLAGVLAVTFLCALAVVVRINLQFTQPQGRYLLPGLPAFAVLIALGLRSLPDALVRVASPATIGVVLLAGNLYALGAVVLPAYHPAPIRTLASGERVMVPSLLNQMAVLHGESHWLVTGTSPEWMAHVEAVADRFAAFEVEVTASGSGSATPAAQRACVYYASTDRAMSANPPVCVDWTADGRPHAIRFPLRGQPGWTREVTHLRLDPFQAGTGVAGVELWTRNPRLVP